MSEITHYKEVWGAIRHAAHTDFHVDGLSRAPWLCSSGACKLIDEEHRSGPFVQDGAPWQVHPIFGKPHVWPPRLSYLPEH